MKTEKPFVLLTLLLTFTLALGLSVALLWLLDGEPFVAQAQGPDGYDSYHVALSCTGVPTPCFGTIQAAVDAADDPDDVVKVASGTYTRVNDYEVVYVSKTVTIRGGYTSTNWTTSYPITQPTTLDAQGQGHVIYIMGDISPTVEGLRITGGEKGGLYFYSPNDGGQITLISNTFVANTDASSYGGGAELDTIMIPGSGPGTTAILIGNTFMTNTASSQGGALWSTVHSITLVGNSFVANSSGFGGVMYVDAHTIMLISNTFKSNTATSTGGALFLRVGDVLMNSNTFVDNTASWGGGAVYAIASYTAVFSRNSFIANTATWWGGEG